MLKVTETHITSMIQPKKVNVDLKYFFAIVICLFFVMTRYFGTDFFDNEWIYSIGPIKILRSSFLASDPFMGTISPFFLLYDILASPFYYFFDFLTATLLCRVLIWIFQIWALSKLARTLGISWWGFILLFVLWLNAEQTLVAGEWIIRSANSKPLAYGFLFLALNSLVQKRLMQSGIFSGLAISFHVLVGLWSAMALSLSVILTQNKSIEGRKIVSFCIAAAVLSLPGLIPALREVILNTSNVTPSSSFLAAPSEVARLSVLLANPFHLDPKYFMTGLEYIKVGLFFLLPLLMIKHLLPKEKARPLIVFLFFLCVFFILGLVARYAEWYRFLKYYPFRVADAFLPLAFWLGFVLLFQKVFYRFKKKGILIFLLVPVLIGGVNYLVELCEPKPQYNFSRKSFFDTMLRTEPRLTAYWSRQRFNEWHTFLLDKRLSDLEKMEFWINGNTPKDSVFITPPWDFSFSLKAQRPDFVSFKCIPVNERIFEWEKRMEVLNRGKFTKVGWGILQELRENYPKLTEQELIKIKKKYGAEYFLANSTVHLNLKVVHENKSFRLYKL